MQISAKMGFWGFKKYRVATVKGSSFRLLVWMPLVLPLLLSGCTSFSFPTFGFGDEGESEVIETTTTVDAVEVEEEGDVDLIDLFRSREDPIANDPNWTPIEPVAPLEPYIAASGSLLMRAPT